MLYLFVAKKNEKLLCDEFTRSTRETWLPPPRQLQQFCRFVSLKNLLVFYL